MDKSLNTEQRLLHMRARPKILLAKTYEEAEDIYKKFNKNLLGIIADIRFPKKNKLEKYAGLDFTKYIRENNESIPILLQSNEQNLYLNEISQKFHSSVLNKNSPKFFKNIFRCIFNPKFFFNNTTTSLKFFNIIIFYNILIITIIKF